MSQEDQTVRPWRHFKNDNQSISYMPDGKNLSFLDDMLRMIADCR